MDPKNLYYKELMGLFTKISLSSTKKKQYESIYNLYQFILKNNSYILKYNTPFYEASEKKSKEIFLELKNEKYIDTLTLRNILLRSHSKYLDNYIIIMSSISNNIPLDIKKYICSYIFY
tara:strand:+ start:720 stop:1076 length:357 start_codon:yes stop_codon:yes gene_type:complete